MLGLNHRHIARAPGKEVGIPAHESHDGSYVLDREPDLIFYGMPRLYVEPVSPQRAIEAGYPSDHDLMQDPRFRRSYGFTHLRVEDGRGGSSEQHYTVSVIEPPPNRPPYFTTVPVVDVQVNQPYEYDADAVDPDDDALAALDRQGLPFTSLPPDSPARTAVAVMVGRLLEQSAS